MCRLQNLFWLTAVIVLCLVCVSCSLEFEGKKDPVAAAKEYGRKYFTKSACQRLLLARYPNATIVSWKEYDREYDPSSTFKHFDFSGKIASVDACHRFTYTIDDSEESSMYIELECDADGNLIKPMYISYDKKTAKPIKEFWRLRICPSCNGFGDLGSGLPNTCSTCCSEDRTARKYGELIYKPCLRPGYVLEYVEGGYTLYDE